MANLLFRDPATTGSPVDLVFNETYNGNVPVRVEGEVPGLTAVVVLAGEPADVEVSGTMPGLTAVVELLVGLSTPDYLQAGAQAPWREATGADVGAVGPWGAAPSLQTPYASSWREGAPLSDATGTPWKDSATLGTHSGPLAWREAGRVSASTRLPWRPTVFVIGDRPRLVWREGARLTATTRLPWQDGHPLLVSVVQAWRQGQFNAGAVRTPWGWAYVRSAGTREPWRDGTSLLSHGSPFPPVVPPDPEVCYTPNTALLFRERVPFGPDLLFYCENHPTEPDATVVVPVKRIYTVLDSFLLKRVVDNVYVPTLAASMTLDVDSWTWTMQFTAPKDELAQVEADEDGTPVELEATINGVAYRFLAEQVSRSRAFPTGSIAVSCRGIGAALDLLSGTYSNDGDPETAAQLMDAVLTVNGVGVGWTVDFGLEDWDVPAGAWNFSGTAVEALRAIAGAAGGYLQPHPIDKTLLVLPRYPDLPWAWGTVTPDYELPSAAVTRESIQWVEKPRYNRVFVSGQSVGVLGQVTREGTDGSLVAPGVVDQLITDTVAARQRGGSILADTGPQQRVSLSLPILAETGIIPPGKYVRYVDGATTRLGITRSVSVTMGARGVGHRQTIEVECHV